jgi:hypothetical protein
MPKKLRVYLVPYLQLQTTDTTNSHNTERFYTYRHMTVKKSDYVPYTSVPVRNWYIPSPTLVCFIAVHCSKDVTKATTRTKVIEEIHLKIYRWTWSDFLRNSRFRTKPLEKELMKTGKDGNMVEYPTGSLVNGGFLAFLPRWSSCSWINCWARVERDLPVGGSLLVCCKHI